MAKYRVTKYFEKVPSKAAAQEKNRHRFWGQIPELGARYSRVITLADKVTIHNAFLDRRFKP
jgi:hypothetical protein